MKNLFLLSFLVLLSSCAGRYSEIIPKRQKYEAINKEDAVSIHYKYDVMRMNKNKKMAKRAEKKGIKIIAAKITNNTDRPLTFGQEVKLFTEDRELLVMSHDDMYSSLKQIPATYFLFLGLLPINLTVTRNGQTDVTPIGYIVGPLLALVNVSVSASANNNMKKEFEDQYLIGKSIPAGETVYGLIGLRQVEYFPLSLKVISEGEGTN